MAEELPLVRITTSMGVIDVVLDRVKAPNSVANFLRYAREGFYNGTIFHRVIPNFMIQGGGLDVKMHKKGVHDPIVNEADNGLHNITGTLAMARTSAPNSATAQFFINTHDNSYLDFSSKTMRGWGYAVFGRVVRGMSVVRQIEAEPTVTLSGRANVPRNPVVIERIAVIRPAK
ncbi:MAG: peptidylprolyl isomerase [Mariprofundales bacterium]